MATTATEKYNGRSGEFRSPSNREDRVWVVKDASDAATAVAAAIVAADPTITTDNGATLYRSSASWQEIDSGNGAWEVTIKYEGKERIQTEPNTVRIEVSTQGGTQHITEAKELVHVYGPATGTYPLFGTSIGVTADSVEGVDITIPVLKFTVTKTFTLDTMPTLSTLYGLTGKTNNASFTVTDTLTNLSITLLEGECLCQGVNVGRAKADGNIDITYEFAGSQSIVNKTVGDITGINAKGWEYIWVMYEGKAQGTLESKVMTQTAKFAVVNKVYEEGDFSGLSLS